MTTEESGGMSLNGYQVEKHRQETSNHRLGYLKKAMKSESSFEPLKWRRETRRSCPSVQENRLVSRTQERIQMGEDPHGY
jgi:hypothetical protein